MGVPAMSPTMQRLVGGIGSMLHRPEPSEPCPFAGHTYPVEAIDRHGHGVFTCPGCHRHVRQPIPADAHQVIVPPHERLRSVTVTVVDR